MRLFFGSGFCIFFISACVALVLAGGAAVQLTDPTLVAPPELSLQGGLAIASAALAALLGVLLYWKVGRLFTFHLILWSMLLLTSVGLSEFAASFFTPAWPVRGLHGVPPADRGPWVERATSHHPGAEEVNSWGERDREHRVEPPADRPRVVFIGDSFLEDSSTTPLPVAVQQRLGDKGVEIVNLGVSATDPDEYYWRLRYIALALHPAHIVVNIYAGNDFIVVPSMTTHWGIAAAYPRRSLLSVLGLTRLNHVLTNSERPILRAWRGAGDLAEAERKVHDALAQAGDEDMPTVLSGAVPPAQRSGLVEYLDGLDLADFYAGLRDPDAGLFRSYYLTAALRAWGPPPNPRPGVNFTGERYVFWLVQQMAALCRDAGVDFTVEIAPEASQVDPRFQAYWGSFSHLAEAMAYTKILSDQLVRDAQAAGIPVVDLFPALSGVSGTYYNLDGHWSDLGVDTASLAVAQYLSDWLDRRSAKQQ